MIMSGDLLLSTNGGMEMFDSPNYGQGPSYADRSKSDKNELLFVLEVGEQQLSNGVIVSNTKTFVLTTKGIFYIPVWQHGKKMKLVAR